MSLRSHSHLVQARLRDLDWIDEPVRLQPNHPVQFRATLQKMVEEWPNGNVLSRQSGMAAGAPSA